MKIIIVGNGKVGYAIASQLAGEHHDITMVDSSPTALHRAENALDVMCIQGNGSSISVLKEAGAQSADLVIAVTNLDETNLLCCFIAKKLGAGHTIARVRSTEYRRDADMLKKEIDPGREEWTDFPHSRRLWCRPKDPGPLPASGRPLHEGWSRTRG